MNNTSTITTQQIITTLDSGALDSDIRTLNTVIAERMSALGISIVRLPHVPQAPKTTNISDFSVGQTVWFNKKVAPRYLIGVEALVVKVNRERVKVRIKNPSDAGRFEGDVNCPISILSLTKVFA